MNKYTLFIIMIVALISCNNATQYDATGTFEATEILVSAESSGKIIRFEISEGQRLEAGQEVGFIDTLHSHLHKQLLLNNINAIESRRPNIKKQIAVIEQQIVSQNHEKERISKLVEANAANRKQLDDINANIALLERQFDAQKSSLEITSSGIDKDIATLITQVQQAEDLLSKCKIINPINGVVLAKYAEANEFTATSKPLYKIANLENTSLRAYVTSNQLSQIQIGNGVKVFADFGTQTREYAGTITWISDKSEFTPKTIQTKDERANLVYAVKIAVKNDGFIKIGMYGQIIL